MKKICREKSFYNCGVNNGEPPYFFIVIWIREVVKRVWKMLYAIIKIRDKELFSQFSEKLNIKEVRSEHCKKSS